MSCAELYREIQSANGGCALGVKAGILVHVPGSNMATLCLLPNPVLESCMGKPVGSQRPPPFGP